MLYPCPQCQKLSRPGIPCGHCGYFPVDHGAAIVSWLAPMTAEQRAIAIANEPAQNWPGSLTRTYPGRDPNEATARYQYEATLLYEAGYRVVSQMWAGGGASIGDYAAFGALAVLRTDTTALVVTFSRQA